jgi:hypothetical protein
VTRNQGWANVGPPSRNAAGNAVAAPPLGADLHYVISAYGQDSFTCEILLGHVVAAFHEEPVLTRAAIRKALAPNPPDPTIPPPASQSKLADQFEQIRITLASPTSEELSRLWSSFSAPYRPSAFFDVGVVLIDPRRTFQAPLPVAGVGVAASDIDSPEIDACVADGPANSAIVSTSTLIVSGRNLAGDGVEVRLGNSVATPASVGETELRVPVSAFTPAPRAGIAGLIVSHTVAIGDPAVDHRTSVSDAFPIGLRPTVTLAGNAVTIGATGTIEGVAVASGTIAVGVAPKVAREQQAVLLLTEIGAPAGRAPRGLALPAPANNGVPPNGSDTSSITFAFTNVARGPYVVRLRIDGVESPLALGVAGLYDSPKVTL